MLQLNNIGASTRKSLQIIDEFKTKLNSNHDYIKQLFQIDIIHVLKINDVDSCSSQSCFSNKSACINQLIDNNDQFSYKSTVKMSNYEIISSEQNLYQTCTSNCEDFIDYNFQQIEFSKLNYVIYKKLDVNQQLFIKFLFKIDSIRSNQLIYYLEFINEKYFMSCEIIDQKIEMKFNFDNIIKKIDLKKDVEIGFWYQLQVLVKDQVSLTKNLKIQRKICLKFTF